MFLRRKRALTWPEVFARVRREFPDVRQIRCAELSLWLTQAGDAPPLLIDVRDADEFSISHLPGARHVPPDSDPLHELVGVPRDHPVVAYCAAGVRSSRYVKRMVMDGFTNVANLEGSIFQWANEGRPLEVAGHPTHTVHPCDDRWRVLLREDLWELPA